MSTIIALNYVNKNYLHDKHVSRLIRHYAKNGFSKRDISFKRLVEAGDWLDTTCYTQWSLIDKITTSALYCDLHPLSENYFSDVKTYSESDNIYLLTHCAMALNFIEENHCKHETDTDFVMLKKKIASSISQYIDTCSIINDPYIESVTMLYYSGFPIPDEENCIKKIISSQLNDGGWANLKNKSVQKSNEHTTVLAIWALCAYQNKNKSTVNWIVK